MAGANGCHNAGEGGFTLVEVLVALAVMVFIIGATHQILDVTTRTKEASEQTLDELSRLQNVFRMLEQDFSQITKRKVRNEAGDTQEQFLMHERYLFDSEFDGIGFVRSGWTNPGYLLPRSELQAVAYRVQEGRLERLYRLYVDQLDSTEPRVQVLLEGVQELTFEFYDSKGEQPWQPQWQQEGLPKAVSIELTLKDREPIKRLFLLAGQGKEAKSGEK
ncbi:type II secretion system minor pseudopilin GspJ [Pseudoalteromonas sp. MM17-2]|uniref:type II secretion system minor pseudopilin GspJ n=1 Tax=Pseudoalteromonas sp. MM17-2 TaxID=2917753 RepID=UPI001EF4A599|nr:type II secretion system minor pseudopilin GspJ [Pseudoalteromonas sp. MM17-2]MCG7544750.1 type II secretion system minor pseudopilin GspJ [Pseudoalteromonas sp. MM17-2]